VSQFEYRFGYAIGADSALKHYTHNLATHWLRGQRAILAKIFLIGFARFWVTKGYDICHNKE